MEISPAARAIVAAGFVIATAFAVYAGAAALDRFPELVVGAFGAVLGANVAINAIVARDVDDGTTAGPVPPALVVGHQAAIGLVVLAIVTAGVVENPWWFGAAMAAMLAWLVTFRAVVHRVAADGTAAAATAPAARETSEPSSSVYPRAFQVAALALAAWLIAGAVAVDTPWMWRPTDWDDFQGPIWLVLLEGASLPLTLIAWRARSSRTSADLREPS